MSQSTIVAWPVATFLSASSSKCSSAFTKSTNACGPHSMASHISAFVHGFPFLLDIRTSHTPGVSVPLGVQRQGPLGTLNFCILAFWLSPPSVGPPPCALSNRCLVVAWLDVFVACVCSLFYVAPCPCL